MRASLGHLTLVLRNLRVDLELLGDALLVGGGLPVRMGGRRRLGTFGRSVWIANLA